MRNVLRCTLSLAATGLVVAVVLHAAPVSGVEQAGQTPASTQGGTAAGLPDTPTTPLFVRLCADCHEVDRVVSRRRTVGEWRDTLRQMIEDGAEGTDEEFDQVLEFLATNFGAVMVNGARAEELVRVLGLSTKDAEAIVAYRTTKGDFKDLEALKQVPEIDAARLEARKSSLRF